MEITVEHSQLLDAVSKLQRVVAAKTSLPVLEGILFSAESGKLTLAAYNLEMGMKKEIPARCDSEGDIVISARLLADILRRMNSSHVEISADERLMCHIRGGEAVFEIMGMAATDFPEMPSVSDGVSISIQSSVLSSMVRGTLFAVAQTEGTRPILTGINFTVDNGILQLVAIDGCRLAIRRENVNISESLSFVVSGKAIGEAVKLSDDDDAFIEIIVGKRLISFVINGYSFISRLLEGEFVNYQKTIPTEYKQNVTVVSSELINVVERVSLLISDSFLTPLRCYFSADKVVFSCASSVGRATEVFPLSLEGDEFEIGLNSRYLLEALKAAESDRIRISFNGGNAGVVITEPDGNDYKYMIMPMRLK